MKKIAILASGSGSNAEKIIEHFTSSPVAKIELLLSNRADAYALKRAENLGVDSAAFTRDDLNSGRVTEILRERGVDYVVLAGFLWLIPKDMAEEYSGRIVNIHPALLPKYGGRGMFGDNVHRAVIAAGEKESGITIHLVNDKYDDGDILFQARVEVAPDDTPETLAQKIHALEHKYFPSVIEKEISKLP